MKKSIILAIFSYIFLISSVRFVYSSVFSNLDLSHLILAFCLFFISIIILVIEKPFNQSYKNRKLKNSFYISNYSAPKIPGIKQEFQQRQVLQLQRRLSHVFLLSRYKNGF